MNPQNFLDSRIKFLLLSFSVLTITLATEKVCCDANVVKETSTGEMIPLPLLKYCPDVVYFVCGSVRRSSTSIKINVNTSIAFGLNSEHSVVPLECRQGEKKWYTYYTKQVVDSISCE